MPLTKKGLGFLIVTLFVGILIGGTIGQLVGIFIPEDHPATEVLIKPLLEYHVGQITIDLIVLRFSFELTLRIGFFSIIGILFAWYYFKYYY